MERKGWIAAKWEMAKERNRELKYYRLTPGGRKQLVREESRWKQVAAAVTMVMAPIRGERS
jgi:PadR family transcriptional regulator, regulatory protein PadR